MIGRRAVVTQDDGKDRPRKDTDVAGVIVGQSFAQNSWGDMWETCAIIEVEDGTLREVSIDRVRLVKPATCPVPAITYKTCDSYDGGDCMTGRAGCEYLKGGR